MEYHISAHPRIPLRIGVEISEISHRFMGCEGTFTAEIVPPGRQKSSN